MKRVILESPYAGDIERNVAYARACVRDSLSRGESPIASHLLYTQPRILRDDVPAEREWGIAAGLAWRSVADYSVFYADMGWSGGMLGALHSAINEWRPFKIRALVGVPALPSCLDEDMEKILIAAIDPNPIESGSQEFWMGRDGG